MDHSIMKTSKSKHTFTEEIKGTASEIISQVKKLIKEGNARRIIIEDNKGKVLFQSQLTVGLAGTAVLTVIAPVVAAISMFALFINDVKIIVERYPDEDQAEEDEYEVEAEIIEIRNGDDESDEEENDEGIESETGPDKKPKTEKTVGKDEEQ